MAWSCSRTPRVCPFRIFNKLYVCTLDTSKTRGSAGYYCILACTKALPFSGLYSILDHLEIWQLSLSLGLWDRRIPRYITRVPNQGWLCSPGDIWPSLEPVFIFTTRVGVVLFRSTWVEARDTAKHPTMHSIAPPTKNYLVQSASSAKVERLWHRMCSIQSLKRPTSCCTSLFIVGDARYIIANFSYSEGNPKNSTELKAPWS